MTNKTVEKSATQLLRGESEEILHILKNQEVICTTCPIVEEIMDTKLFGFSEKVNFAAELGLIEEEVGQQLLSDLEHSMNRIWEKITEKQQ